MSASRDWNRSLLLCGCGGGAAGVQGVVISRSAEDCAPQLSLSKVKGVFVCDLSSHLFCVRCIYDMYILDEVTSSGVVPRRYLLVDFRGIFLDKSSSCCFHATKMLSPCRYTNEVDV